MRSDSERLPDILEAIERIQRYTARGREAFEADELVQVWVGRHLEIVGEAAARLSESVRAAHPAVPWRQVIGMPNVLAHGYFDVDLDLVWSVVERDLAGLHRAVARAERDLRADGDEPSGGGEPDETDDVTDDDSGYDHPADEKDTRGDDRDDRDDCGRDAVNAGSAG